MTQKTAVFSNFYNLREFKFSVMPWQFRGRSCFGDILNLNSYMNNSLFIGFAYQGKDIVFRFIIEYSSLRDFSP
jgi:hypothetical protein